GNARREPVVAAVPGAQARGDRGTAEAAGLNRIQSRETISRLCRIWRTMFSCSAAVLQQEKRTSRMTKLIGISGSLRKASFNKALLHAALPLAPEGVRFSVGTIEGIPLYNADVEREGVPEAVQVLK